jgi:capsular exopolysaccharide synthesis family protein
MANTKGFLDAGIEEILKHNLGAISGVQDGIVSAAENRDLRTLLVTSCNRGEGKTVTSIGMATALAGQANAQVLLLDGHFAAPALHEHFGIPRQPGLSEFLTTDIGLEEVVCRTDDPRLLLIPSGGAGATPFGAGRDQALAQRFASLREKFDYVICDGRAVFASAEVPLAAGLFDGIVLVVECERTRWEVVQDAKERLQKAGGRLLGVVLNKRRYYIPKALYAGA